MKGNPFNAFMMIFTLIGGLALLGGLYVWLIAPELIEAINLIILVKLLEYAINFFVSDASPAQTTQITNTVFLVLSFAMIGIVALIVTIIYVRLWPHVDAPDDTNGGDLGGE